MSLVSLVALVLALVAVPFAVLDLRVATACLAGAGALAGIALIRGEGVWTARGALRLVLVGSLLAGWELWELRRPTPAATPALPIAQPGGQNREVVLPLIVERAPITRLALLEFATDADPVYVGLEPQLIERGGKRGVRIVAYRHDGRVDVYDDLPLSPEPDDRSRVTGGGRLHYRHTDLGDPVLEVDRQGRVRIEFAFLDAEGRAVRAAIREHTRRRSVPLNLLAPVGMSSTDPEFFPLFLMHDFEFVRLGGTQLDVTIDGSAIDLAPFPVPLPVQGQRRSFAKYTMNAEITEVFPTGATRVETVITDSDLYRRGASTYVFDGTSLAGILSGSTEFVFAPPLDIGRAGEGTLTMTSRPGLGSISGTCAVRADGATTRLAIELDEVHAPDQRGLLYRLIVNDASMFAQWPKAYRYQATSTAKRAPSRRAGSTKGPMAFVNLCRCVGLRYMRSLTHIRR